jgi:hypothetical protein
MRLFATVTATVMLALAAGCTNTNWGFLNKERDQPVQGAPPTKEAVVAYLNENAGRIQSFRSDDLHITVHQGVVPFGLNGVLMAQKPRDASIAGTAAVRPQHPDFRLSADALGSRVVDLGSNNNEFWWWISKDDPPDQYFCSYKDLEDGRVRALPFPFQPEWIMETMGMGVYGPADKYEMDFDAYTLKLTERLRTPQGNMVRKVIVMKRKEQKAPSPQIVDFLLLDDASGTELCSAHISETQVNNGAIVPRRLELRWPKAKARLDMRLAGIAVNTPLPQTAFERQAMSGVRSVDLAQMFAGPPVQRVQGTSNP